MPLVPTEIWLHIINLIEENRTLMALSQVSTASRSLVQMSFKTLHFAPHRGPRASTELNLVQVQLLKALETSPLTNIVTNLRIRLFCLPADGGTTCMCGELDKMLKNAFQSMNKLSDLDFYCTGCKINCRHQCLSHITSQNLLSISFRCYCAGQVLYPEQVLPIPVLNTLKALRWCCNRWIPRGYPHMLTDVGNRKVLPNLNVLACYGSTVEEMLLETRAIRRVWFADRRSWEDGSEQLWFKRTLTAGESFTHAVFESFLTLRAILIAPCRFADLQHVGTLPARPFHAIARLTGRNLPPRIPLPHLFSIDAVVLDGKDPWDAGVLAGLRYLPKLRRVLIHGYKFCIWEFREDVWEVRAVPRFSAWDIIRGTYD